MKEQVKVMELDRSGQGVVMTALSDLHNKRMEEGKSPAVVDDLIKDLYNAPTKRKKVRVRGEAR